jgi:hypothetical protein
MAFDTYNFTGDYQDTALACFIRYPEEFWSHNDIIKPEYFTGVDAFEVAFQLKAHVEKYGKYPNFSTLSNVMLQKFERSNPDKATQLVEYTIKLDEVDTSDWESVRDTLVYFAKERAIYAGLKKILAAQKENRTDEVNPIEEMEKALAVGTDTRKAGVSLKRDYAAVIDRATQVAYGVRTGYPLLDAIWKNGWAPGWLIVPLAPPKSYKTTFCINLALKMLGPSSEGDVIYFACEISEELAMMRALHNLSDIGANDLFEQGVETFKIEAQKGIKKKIGKGNLWFKSFASKSATISEMEQHVKYLIAQEGAKPKVIIVDYAETVRPTLTGKNVNDWRQQADIYTQARAMGTKLGCCVIMPDRCNRETVGKQVPSMKSFQGSFEKAGIVDVAIGICFTDQERLQNRVRYFVFLNRHGPQLLHYSGRVDPEKMRMTIDEKIPYTPEDEEETNRRSSKKGKFSKSLREAMDSDD